MGFKIDKFIGKAIAGAVIAILFCGFLYTFTKDKMVGTKEKDKTVPKGDNHTLIITVLSIMGLVFLVFAIVQFNSLFISKESIVENTTFAKTAREGYFQLVVLSVINFIMVLMCTQMQNGSNKISQNIIKVLTTYFTLLNVYLLASSAYKMTLYYYAYGLSVERLLVYILLTFEFFALMMLLVKIYKSDMPFIKIMIYYIVAFWALVSLINIEAWVVKVNVNRYEETEEIDISYLQYLSSDASNEIKKLYIDSYDKLTNKDKEMIYTYFYDKRDFWDGYQGYDIEDNYSLERYEQVHKICSWLEFSISKARKYNDGLELLEMYLEH